MEQAREKIFSSLNISKNRLLDEISLLLAKQQISEFRMEIAYISLVSVTRLSSFFVRDNLMSYFIRTIVYILYFNEGLGSNLPKSLPTICLADGISLKCSLTS